MTTAAIAAILAVLALGFIEGVRRFYPAQRTWARLRRINGRTAVRAMRQRAESAAAHKAPRTIASVFLLLAVIWVAVAEWLDKHWYEVALDTLPYALGSIALLRTPGALFEVAERMRKYERDAGEDPDADPEEETGGSAELAL